MSQDDFYGRIRLVRNPQAESQSQIDAAQTEIWEKWLVNAKNYSVMPTKEEKKKD